MKDKIKECVFVVALVLAFIVGRYSVQQPEVTKNDEKSIEVQQETHQDTNTTTTITESPRGDKTTTIISHTVADSGIKTVESERVQTSIKSTKATTNLSLIATADYRELKPIYGLSVSKEVLGPVTIGLFGLTSGTIGISVGVNF